MALIFSVASVAPGFDMLRVSRSGWQEQGVLRNGISTTIQSTHEQAVSVDRHAVQIQVVLSVSPLFFQRKPFHKQAGADGGGFQPDGLAAKLSAYLNLCLDD
jgi:hypothetical protein